MPKNILSLIKNNDELQIHFMGIRKQNFISFSSYSFDWLVLKLIKDNNYL